MQNITQKLFGWTKQKHADRNSLEKGEITDPE